ncbi:MAG: radical SAM protein [Planctomycetota bacterium]|nr:radical SAM protein [Planctomycetota bacterium]
MELPFREKGDELLRPGAMLDMRARLREHAKRHDLRSVAAYAFDHRTRMLPFYFVDRRMSPGGVRAIGGSFLEAGFEKTRVVLQTWKKRFQPSLMQLDGSTPDLFMTSSMWIHSGRMRDMLRDICRVDAEHRPLVIAGGPHMVYNPWDAFSSDAADPWRADVAVTGELYVLLELMDVLLTERAHGEPLRRTFLRVRDAGGLDHVPGLVYANGADGAVPEELVDTGVQRLLQDLDELPHPVHGYKVLEPAGGGATLAKHPIPTERVGKHSPIASIEMTYGCKFRCKYCPIPAYNQHQDREKSPERIADEMKRLREEYGIRFFFGSDDNFFNRHDRAQRIVETLAATTLDDGTPLRKALGWGTEATVHDTIKMKEHLRTARHGGMKALWMGVEDMTATFVKKGQSVDKTREAFHLLWRNGINPMPMLMHDDTQPLVSFRNARGLLNQVQLLRNARAMSVQVLMLSPAPGSKLYEDTYSGLAFRSVNGRPVEPHLVDGNHVVASRHKRPWIKQLNILFAYAYFYNPLRLLKALVLPKNRRGHFADAGAQIMGMCGWLQNLWRTPRWLYHLMRGGIERFEQPPASPIPFRSAAGGRAAHGLPNQTVTRTAPTPEEPARLS